MKMLKSDLLKWKLVDPEYVKHLWRDYKKNTFNNKFISEFVEPEKDPIKRNKHKVDMNSVVQIVVDNTLLR